MKGNAAPPIPACGCRPRASQRVIEGLEDAGHGLAADLEASNVPAGGAGLDPGRAALQSGQCGRWRDVGVGRAARDVRVRAVERELHVAGLIQVWSSSAGCHLEV